MIDGDGAARAVPTLPLCSFSVRNPKHHSPIALAAGRGDVLMVTTNKVKNFEGMLRNLLQVDPFGNSASLALWPDKVRVLKNDAIQNTVSNALYCGKLFEGISKKNGPMINQALPFVNRLQGYLIRSGTIIYKVNSQEGGFSFDTTKIRTNEGETITVIGQNENLMAFSDMHDGPIAMAPDSICFLTREMVPLGNGDIKETKKPTKLYIHLIAVCANDRLGEEEIIIGFDNHVQELRYNTRFSGQKPAPERLGDLIRKL